MSDVTQPRMARGTMLSAGIAMAALVALLVFAPLASAASNPVGSSSTASITINNGFKKGLTKKGVSILRVAPATLKGANLKLKVTGGKVDPANGKGTVNLKGGLKFKAGKKNAVVQGLVLNTTKKQLTGNVGGKKMTFAKVGGLSKKGSGFNTNLTIKQLKITGAAANKLNQKLGLKGKAAAFKANQLMGSAKSTVKPTTVTVKEGGSMTFGANLATLSKLTDEKVGVKITTVAPTTIPALGSFGFPVTGGNLAPNGKSGKVQGAGELVLTQSFGPTAETVIKLGAFAVDFDSKTIVVTAQSTSTASKELNLTPQTLSIADLTGTGVVSSDGNAHTISVAGEGANLQELATIFLNGFVQVAEGAATKKLVLEGKSEAEAKAIAKAAYANNYLKSGESLGTFSFTAQTN